MRKPLMLVPFLAWAGLSVGADTALAAPGIEEGRRFPDLALSSLVDGSPGKVSDFRGTKLVLHVFASW